MELRFEENSIKHDTDEGADIQVGSHFEGNKHKKSSSKKHMQPPMMRIDDLEGGSQEMPELPFEKEEPVSKPKAVNILKIEDPNSRNINTQFTNTPKDGFEEAYQKPLSSRRSQGS